MNSFLMMGTATDAEWRRGLIGRNMSIPWSMDLPSLPNEHIQTAFTGKTRRNAFLQAFEAVEKFVAGARELGKALSDASTVLDFGIGWGRITQTAYRYFDPKKRYRGGCTQ